MRLCVFVQEYNNILFLQYDLYKNGIRNYQSKGFLQVLEIQGGVNTLSFAPATIQ